MRIARFLLPGFVVALGVTPAVAQPRRGGMTGSADLVPSVRPVSAEEPALMPQPAMPPPTTDGRPTMSSLEQMGTPAPYSPASGDPVGTLTGQPRMPAGSYPGPYSADGPGCCGPLGSHGRTTYEVYSYSGVNFTIGNGLADRLYAVGWTVGGGARTLLFDASNTAAWTIDVGGSYTYNRGVGAGEPTALFLRTQPVQNQQTGGFQVVPDRFVVSAIRGIHRSSFNFAFGRDLWLMGDGTTGGMQGTNWRIGGWVGGRYGTSHIDIVPLNEVNGYSRRQTVFHGMYTGVHTTLDVPMGAVVWTNGIRAEYGFDWMNLAPPIQANLNNINVQFTTGFRF